MEGFLKVEYESCLGLIKYYDERHLSLVKFTTGISSSAISLVFGFYALGASVQNHFWSFAAVLTGVAGLGLLAVFVAMIQNRLYFVYPARQVNAIRKVMLQKVASEFTDNQMYISSDFPAFKFLSLHALMNLLVAFQVGAFIGFCWFSISLDMSNVASSIRLALLIGGLASIALFSVSSWYLASCGRYHPDRSVHREKERSR